MGGSSSLSAEISWAEAGACCVVGPPRRIEGGGESARFSDEGVLLRGGDE